MAKAKSKSKPKTVQVEIRAKQTVHYRQIVQMSAEDFRRYEEVMESGEYRQQSEICKELAEIYINMHDVFDADDIDGEDVEIE